MQHVLNIIVRNLGEICLRIRTKLVKMTEAVSRMAGNFINCHAQNAAGLLLR